MADVRPAPRAGSAGSLVGGRATMLVAGLKRLGQLVGLVLAVALVLAVLGALLLHVPFRRSLSVTCYGLGGFFLLSGFFHGVRPAIRVEDDSGVMSMFGLLLTSGKLRTAPLGGGDVGVPASGRVGGG